jgi:hypothetical protein
MLERYKTRKPRSPCRIFASFDIQVFPKAPKNQATIRLKR